MAYHSTDTNGVTLINPDEKSMEEIIKSVFDSEDSDYPDVSLMHESGWTLVYADTETLVLENVDGDEDIRFIRNVSPLKALEFWVMLAKGDLEALFKLQWSIDT